MKNIFFALAVVLLAGCGGTSNSRPASQGAPYELIVVADHPVWDGAAGDTLRSIFYRRFPMINRDETRFDLLRILPRDLKNLPQKHPNILIARVDPTAGDPLISMNENVWAEPQIVITASAPSVEELAALIGRQGDNLLAAIEGAERLRDIADATGRTPEAISTAIREKFGFTMYTYPGYAIRDEGKENFLWLSYEMPTASQGIAIYTYPFSSSADLTREALVARRNEFVKLIPGETAGSCMTTVDDLNELLFRKIEDRSWAELRGFWSVEGDFMGGPMVNYSTVDIEKSRVIAIDFYVYSPDPRLSQRSFIHQLEHLLYTVSFP